MLIAHISDFHIFSTKPETFHVRLDAEAAARKVVADVVAFPQRIDAVFFTGDLADGGSDADYALAKDVLSPIQVPVFVIPGNHDSRAPFRRAFAGLMPYVSPDTLHYEAQVGDVRVLALDTLIEGVVAGRLDAGQLAWLRERLAVVTEGPTYLLLHHPAFISGIHALDGMALMEGADELGEMVRNYPGALRILSGHVHRPFQAVWNGVFCAVAGASASQIALDFDPAIAEPELVNEPYAYFIHRLTPDGGLSIHTRYVAI